MIGRLAFRSLTAHPVRSAVLAAGFGVGVAVMAILLGVAEVVLDQARAPALVGGGDVVIRLAPQVPAHLVLSGTLQSNALRDRVRVAAPSDTARLYLVGGGRVSQVRARAGIPSLERALGDREVAAVEAWRDAPGDVAWTQNAPENVLRSIDRFHPIPDAPAWGSSWAEWLYFNGRAEDVRFYLTFLVGPRREDGRRSADVRLQLERRGHAENFNGSAAITDAEALRAPDLTIGRSHVRLDGLRYRIHLDLRGRDGRPLTGDLSIQATPEPLLPPLEITGARGWRTGYVVPVMSGSLDGELNVAGNRVSLDGGTGYHDHNWGFWQGVSWQWGQVYHEDLSFIYGRIFPPPDAADRERMPGFVGGLGPDGPLGYATQVTITETNDEHGQPRRITVGARSSALELQLQFDVGSSITSRDVQGLLNNNLDFLQLRGQYTVSGRAGQRDIRFTAPGSAETFRHVSPP
ncbi:MAG TPA: hypothetical protein VIX63_15715 [Vicinamibacterales bacterium]